MSEPKNHHYLSQVLIRKFIDSDENLFTYSKKDQKLNESILSRFDFAEIDLNTTVDEHGNIDRHSIEKILNKYFETDFTKHYDKIIGAVNNNAYSGALKSLKYLVKMGIIGDMRTPEHQQETQEIFLESIRTLIQNATDEVKSSFIEFENSLSDIKNKTHLNFKETADKIFELMGKKVFSIFRAPPQDFFFLPDCTSVVLRDKLGEDSIINGKTFINDGRQIATVIFPIDSSHIVVAQSAKICPQNQHGTYVLPSNMVDSYNLMFLKSARDKVICRDKDYLKQFINRHVNKN